MARALAKRYQESLKDIHEKVNSIKQRFQLDAIEYNDEWSVPQFYACLTTLLTYANKWQEKLSSLRGISNLISKFLFQRNSDEI